MIHSSFPLLAERVLIPFRSSPALAELHRALRINALLWGPGTLVYLALTFSIGRIFTPLDAIVQAVTALSNGCLALALFGGLKLTARWEPWRRFLLMSGVVFLLAAAQAGLDNAGIVEITERLIPKLKAVYGEYDRVWFLRTAFLYFWVDCLNVSLLLLSEAIERVRSQERALAEARLTAQQAQLAALRFQLNPHFLFNTLNAISALVIEAGATEAETMISKLSEFLRASLSSETGDLIPLEDELETIQAYLDIESVRFGERLAVEFTCAPNLADALVPSLLLQPLAENAVKYAVAPAKRTVTVRIEASQDAGNLVLIVADDGDPLADAKRRPGTGVGLSNVRRRLEALYGSEGVLETFPGESGFLALIRLPLRRVEAAARERELA